MMTETWRVSRVKQKFFYGEELFGWHSAACICDDCLDSDMAVSIFEWNPEYRDHFDLEGLR